MSKVQMQIILCDTAGRMHTSNIADADTPEGESLYAIVSRFSSQGSDTELFHVWIDGAEMTIARKNVLWIKYYRRERPE